MRSARTLLALPALALLAAGCPIGGFRPVSPDPVIAVDNPNHDFGSIPNSATVEHIFTVKNKGGKPLNIARVQTSCGCTAAVLGHQQLKPGESTPLKVTFDPRGRSGSQARTVWIHSDDPKVPQHQLNVSASIVDANAQPAPQATATLAPAPGATVIAPSPAGSATLAPAPAAGSATAAQP